MMTIDPDLAEAARTALVVRGIEVRNEFVCFPDYPLVATDLETVVVKLRSSRDDAHDEVYWLRILGDGGVPVVPLLGNEVVPILDAFGVVTQYLPPDRNIDGRDAPAAGRVLRLAHDLAFEYLEGGETFWVPQVSILVLNRGVLRVVGIGGAERHTRECARLRAVDGFISGLREDVRSQARAQFLDAYDA